MNSLVTMNTSELAAFALNEANDYLNKETVDGSASVGHQGRTYSQSLGSAFVPSASSAFNAVPRMPSVNINNSTNYSSWGNNVSMGSRDTTIISNEVPPSSKKKDEKESEVQEQEGQDVNYVAFIVGAAIMASAAGIAGSLRKSYNKANEKMDERVGLRNHITATAKDSQDVGLTAKLSSLATAMVNAQDTQTSRINGYALACLVSLAGAASLVVGSFVAEAILVPVGSVLVVVAVAGAIFNFTSHLDDEVLKEQYEAQKRAAEDVLGHVPLPGIQTAHVESYIPVAEVIGQETNTEPTAPPANLNDFKK